MTDKKHFVINNASSLPEDKSRKCFNQIDPRGFSLLHEQHVTLKDHVYTCTHVLYTMHGRQKAVCHIHRSVAQRYPFEVGWLGGWLRLDNIIQVCT